MFRTVAGFEEGAFIHTMTVAPGLGRHRHMAVSTSLGSFLWVLLFGLHNRAHGFWKLPDLKHETNT